MFLIQFLFFLGVNNINQSVILCKFLAILQHYLNLAAYMWLLLIALHLYRMLTELRDINKIGSTPPVFYYLIAYLAPIIVIGLTLGIKQEVYTNYDSNLASMYAYQPDLTNSVYCWLNVSYLAECTFVFILPLSVSILLFLVLIVLSYKELRNTTFKQTDLELVQQSLIGALILFPFMCATTAFLFVFLSSSTAIRLTTTVNESIIYEYLYLLLTFAYSLLAFVLFILLNKSNKSFVGAVCSLLKLKLSGKQADNSTSGAAEVVAQVKGGAQQARQANFLYSNEPYLIPKMQENMTTLERNKMQINAINAKYLYNQNNQMQVGQHINQNNITNSMSTTTTSGTNSSEENGNSQMLMMNGASMAYLSHLANTTTNTESTCSDFNAYHYEFNRPVPMPSLILAAAAGTNGSGVKKENENDLVDVGKILRARNNMMQVNECRELDDDDEDDSQEDEDSRGNNNNPNHPEHTNNDSDRRNEFNNNQNNNIKYINVTGNSFI
jgi:hypothetical protein